MVKNAQIRIALTDAERDALWEVALLERRSEADQAAYFIRQKLEELGVLPAAKIGRGADGEAVS